MWKIISNLFKRKTFTESYFGILRKWGMVDKVEIHDELSFGRRTFTLFRLITPLTAGVAPELPFPPPFEDAISSLIRKHYGLKAEFLVGKPQTLEEVKETQARWNSHCKSLWEAADG